MNEEQKRLFRDLLLEARHLRDQANITHDLFNALYSGADELENIAQRLSDKADAQEN